MADPDIVLNAVQKALFESSNKKLLDHISQFEQKLRKELSDSGWKKERNERSRWFKKVFSKSRIKRMGEDDFKSVFKSLWASNVWSEAGKEWKAKEILKDNGIEKLRNSFYDLFYGEGRLANRYDSAKSSIKGLGDSSLTEIMTFVDPERYCIWNDKPIRVLPVLSLGDLLPKRVFRYGIKGSEYVRCRGVLNHIRKTMKEVGFAPSDFLDVDILMWTLFSNVKFEKKPQKPELPTPPQGKAVIKPEGVGHYDAIALIAKLGKLIGYDVYVADSRRKPELFDESLGEIAQSTKDIPEELKGIKGIERIDVILLPVSGFFEKIYLFEVEDKGTMREALHRLYQCVLLDAKMFVVGPKENQSKFEKYAQTKPFDSLRFREKCQFRNFDELVNLYSRAVDYVQVRDSFFLEKG